MASSDGRKVLAAGLALTAATRCFVDGLDLSTCPKLTISPEVLVLLGVLLCLGGACYLAALVNQRFLRRRPRHGTKAKPRTAANPLDPNRLEYWEGRHLGRGVSLFLPDASKQKELLKSWTQQESLVALGSGSYLLKQPERLLWRDIPEEMLSHVRNDDSVVYAALGPEKQYFLRFRDGDTCWSLWSELSQQIKEQEQKQHRVSVVCIAPNGGYFVLFDSGGWAHNRLPDSLRLFLSEQRDRLPQVDHVSCSNSGAWFVSFRDGQMPRWQCHHLPRRLNERILQLSGGDWKIQSLEFGFDGSWLLRFDARTPLESGC